MITLPDVRYYYQQTAESVVVRKLTEVITSVAFHSFHITKHVALVPATITCMAIGFPLFILNVSLCSIAYGIDLASRKIYNRNSLDPSENSALERLVSAINSMTKYIVPQIVYYLTLVSLSPHIIVAKSIEYVEDIGMEIIQIALNTLGIPVNLHISRKKLLCILNEWKELGHPDENRKSACEKILHYYDRSNELSQHLFYSPRSLYITDCRLRSLPEIFYYKPFSQLNTLCLNRNNLDFLPISLYNLHRDCQLSINHNRFSQDEILAILNNTKSPNYQGPIIIST